MATPDEAVASARAVSADGNLDLPGELDVVVHSIHGAAITRGPAPDCRSRAEMVFTPYPAGTGVCGPVRDRRAHGDPLLIHGLADRPGHRVEDACAGR